MRLRYQLFIILLLSSVAPIALLAWFNSWSFNQGFSNYVVENEKQRLMPVAEQIAQLYDQQNNWSWLETQPQKIRELLRRSNLNSPARVTLNNAKRENRRGQRLILVDSEKQLLVGNELPTSNVVWLPVTLENTTIAYIGIREPRELPGELENAFVAQQLRSYGFAAGAMVILTALMAMVLSSRIVKPILNVNAAIGQLTGGHYKSRIANDHQRDELGTLSRNINQLALTLDQNQSARQQWMAEISYELRTPVAVL